MKTTKNNSSCIRFKIIILVILIISATNISHAASQGKLGRQSSASIGISVQVNQSLTADSPDELLLSQNKSKPLCVMHNGYTQNATVPYELKVDEIKVLDQTNYIHNNNLDTLPFNIILIDKQKQQLTPGISLFQQTGLSTSDLHKQDCQETGMQLSLEMTADHKNSLNTQVNSTGLLILLVSPD